MLKKTIHYSLLISILLLMGCPAPTRVLIFSGSNNHKWEETTPQLVQIIKERTGFEVETTEHPEQITAEKLAKFDGIVSNWNNYNNPQLQWPDTAREALINFVRNGGGHVMVHAGGSSFNEWKDYHRVTAYWGPETGHGPIHEFTVKPTPIEHPITQGISSFETKDELWHNTSFPPESTPLMTAFSSKEERGSGKEEPVLTVNQFGKGRCVNLMLGHDTATMNNQGFQTLLRRSVEWAAIGSVSQRSYWFSKTKDSAALMNNDAVVWQFNYGNDLAKPYFHPIALTDGAVLTADDPSDHPWHHGLWFSWKYINGVNYWEEDRQTGKSKGATDWDNVDIQTHPDGSAEITLDVVYHEPGQSPLLTEKRIIVISAPDKTGVYSINWTSTFTAVADKVELDRTPLPGEQDGQPWGGYAGLSFRIRKDIENVVFTGTKGVEALDKDGYFRNKDSAMDFWGTANDKTFGAAILDHSDNLNSPSPWYCIHNENMAYFSPAVICYKPHIMSKGQSFTLKYKIMIHPTPWDSQTLKDKYECFITQMNK